MKRLLFFVAMLFCMTMYSESPLLLIKIPTRSRPEQFFRILDMYYQKLSHKVPYQFLITCDVDDTTMNCPAVIEKLNSYKNLSYSFSKNNSKVEAYNRDVAAHNFDILLVTSDDLEPVMDGYDTVIVQRMQEAFSDYDGVLNFHDGYVGAQCNTYPVIGKKYYDRFGYVYHPEYKSLYCDEELCVVSKMLRKERVCGEVIIKHNHPVWGAGQWDALYVRNEQLKSQDEATFNSRRAKNFDVTQQDIDVATPKLWSILICTLDERADSFKALTDKVYAQIKELGLQNEIEILAFKDNRQYSVGFKRNELLRASAGKYICFLDDDDDVHDNYISMIYTALKQNPDCVSLTGIISHHGEHRKKFVHSLKYNSYFEQDNVYYRPPNHLNPMRRSVAIQCMFPELNHSEDIRWAMAVTNMALLKTEVTIDEPYYFYQCSDNPLNRYY